MIKIKICGITNLEDALAACTCGADALGFIVAPEAKERGRYIEPDHAQSIIAQLPPFVTTVGVTVNETVEKMRQLLQIFDRLQLHGEESPEECALVGPCAYKAFRVSPEFTPHTLEKYPGQTCLLDAWSPTGRGGTGQTFDWVTAIQASKIKRIILAGGLTPDNVEEAVLRVRPYGIDASSSLESSPGKKDHGRIRIFINNARKVCLAG